MYLVKILGFALLFTTAAQAVTNFDNAPQGAHYAQGFDEPDCKFTSTYTVECTNTQIAGVGNTNAIVNLVVTSTFTGTCKNRGGNLVEPFEETDEDSSTETLTPTRNGQLVVGEQTATAPTAEEFLAGFDCPNRNWTPVVTETVVSFEYTVTFVDSDAPVISITG